ncbi:RNA-guided endonuclease TnpB family protein [Bifidobacterium sp. SO1]|uniref:RNA-guided endonuclease InsQ/TnpB family protein n=1 Tax=Bifidobacterium sp. SO1 TaxID=2809029 RepID=UPI001BDD8C41|nr:RNA-guided endonuclease TnpB family protein [Bifidobacterium sp. SO1]MBT1162948.1 transposase [Bifidobacterium sp. SO1]
MAKRREFQRAYRFRFYPTPEQENLLRRTLGCARLVYNKALEARSKAWTEERRNVTYGDTSALLTGWKKTDEYSYLNEVSCVPLQQALRHLQKAFSGFFKQVSDYPTFKKKSHGGSAEYTRSAFDWDGRNLYLAKMREPLPIRWSRTLPKGAVPSTVTVSLDAAGRWHVSLLVKETIRRLRRRSQAVGLDLGVDSFAVASNGETVANPRHLKRNLERLAKAQQSLSRKQKGSNNYRKARLKVARIQAHVTDSRRDFLHKLSTRIIRENQTIVLEDLAVGNLSRRCEPKPDPEHPGQYLSNGQSAKTGLNRSIMDAGWREFRLMLEYKAEWYGRQLIILDRYYPSTQLCSHCGSKTGPKTLDVRVWTCPDCHTSHDRDLNAAENILAAGLAVSVCKDGRIKDGLSQE